MGLKPLSHLWTGKIPKIVIPIHTLFKTSIAHSP